jgi:ABC-type glycerol-3-phosphate transport system permease component
VSLGDGLATPAYQLRRHPNAEGVGLRTRRLIADFVVYALLIGVGLSMAFPLFWMVSTSLRTEPELYLLPPPLLPIHWTWDNYVQAFQRIPYWRMLWNSTFVAVIVTFGRVITSTFAGYAFSRLRFPGRDKIFLLYLAVLMIPFPVTMVPLYLLMSAFGWIDNLVAIILPPFVSAYNTFLCRQFMLSLPRELEDAARIDGCNPPRIYANVILPLSGPVIAATTIFSFLTTWNSFIWPLIILSNADNQTLPIGLTTLANARINYGGYTPWTLLMAAATAAAIPMIVVYLTAQRHFVRGIALTGLKG